jgi:succinate dehydrogenase / fumarate reductase iron-sulfur subunit
MAAEKMIELRVLRQDSPESGRRWEEFSLPHRPKANLISCLMEVRRHPVTRQGQTTTPVAWESNCLEEVCGSCTMIVNGKPRQACSALVDRLAQPIELRPLTKFPLVRDLVVDRQRMFDHLKRVKAWIPIDGTYALGPGPKVSPEDQSVAYAFSRCMTCGCCMEACPQFGPSKPFIGPAPMAQVRLFNTHPTGKMNAGERLMALMEPGGIQDCGNAQNCVRSCPKEIPLTEGIADLGRQVTLQWLRGLLSK